MKRILTLLAICIAFFAEAQPSLSFINHWQITPNSQDTSGVFCRTFYHSGRNKYYVVYAGRPANQPGGMQYFAWREYDAAMNATGNTGTLPGHSSAGDFAMEMVGTDYYHITAAPPWNFKLSKYDQDFNLVSSVTFPLDSADSQADMLLNYTNGKLVIGAFHVTGEYHPSMPQQQSTWMPTMHKWEYDLSLNAIGSPVYIPHVFTTWGASCIFNSNKYNVISMYKFPQYKLSVYRYSTSWTYIDSVALNNDGQWSQGVIWDGQYYYVAYHSGHEHRSGNITVAIYDVNWSLLYDTTITSNQVFTYNVSPPLNTTQYNANRPYLVKVGDTLVVSYDVDDYELVSYQPIYHEGNRWQAHVTKLRIVGTTGISETPVQPWLNLYPNPVSSGEINVQVDEDGLLEICSPSGALVYRESILRGQRSVSLGGMSAGMYFVRFTSTDGRTVNRKLLVE